MTSKCLLTLSLVDSVVKRSVDNRTRSGAHLGCARLLPPRLALPRAKARGLGRELRPEVLRQAPLPRRPPRGPARTSASGIQRRPEGCTKRTRHGAPTELKQASPLVGPISQFNGLRQRESPWAVPRMLQPHRELIFAPPTFRTTVLPGSAKIEVPRAISSGARTGATGTGMRAAIGAGPAVEDPTGTLAVANGVAPGRVGAAPIRAIGEMTNGCTARGRQLCGVHLLRFWILLGGGGGTVASPLCVCASYACA